MWVTRNLQINVTVQQPEVKNTDTFVDPLYDAEGEVKAASEVTEDELQEFLREMHQLMSDDGDVMEVNKEQ